LIYKRNKKLLKKTALRIKELRLENCVTQEEMYNDTGINIGRIERAINDLSLCTLERICLYFNISLREFFKKDF
jgi:transcriptional regulator with XRE-family HTH domain